MLFSSWVLKAIGFGISNGTLTCTWTADLAKLGLGLGANVKSV